ncbi:MAG: RNA polymerase sigma factor [Pseudomonadota bacterium]
MQSQTAQLNQFLIGVEKKAFKMAYYAVSDTDDAMDIVQDSMLMLARKYLQRPTTEWRPLFFRILQNKIKDCYRKRQSRGKLFSMFNRFRDEDDNEEDVVELHAAPETELPDAVLSQAMSAEAISDAVALLPLRQQQAFLLRSWEGLSVDETATAMSCSQGSVKTHHSRAVHKLRALLTEGDKVDE